MEITLDKASIVELAKAVAPLVDATEFHRPWSPEKLARVLDVHASTIYRRMQSCEISTVPDIGKKRIPFAEVERLLRIFNCDLSPLLVGENVGLQIKTT